MVWPTASAMGSWLGFHAATNTSGSNQNQPIRLSPATGMITPQTLIEPILPVMFGPPKLATMVSQIRLTVPTHSGIAPLPSQGMKAVM
ncbi:hypothetical protein D3C81_1185380 [compost metagenome]